MRQSKRKGALNSGKESLQLSSMGTKTPREIHDLFRDGFNAGSMDALMALYEDQACMRTPTGTLASGKAAIREALTPFLALKLPIGLETVSSIESGDLGLLSA